MKKQSTDQKNKDFRKDPKRAGLSEKDASEQFGLLKNVPIIFCILDREFKIISANDFAIRFFGVLYKSKKYSGVSILKIFGTHNALTPLLEEALMGKTVSREISVQAEEGKTFWIEIHLNPVNDESGHPTDKILLTGTDISERKKKEEDFRQNELSLNKIYGEVPVMIFAIDDQAILRHANKKWLEKTGYRREEVIGKKIKDFLPEESKKIVFGEAIPELLKSRKTVTGEVQLKMKDGSLMDVRFSAVQSKDIDGNFIGLTVVEDISEIKQTREMLIESAEQYQKLIQGLPDVVTVTDIFGRIDFISQNSRLLPLKKGLSKSVGSNILSWIHADFHDSFTENIQKLIDGEKYIVGVYDLLTDSDPKHIEVRSTLIHDAHGKPKGYISVLRDITHTKKSEDELKIKEQILDQMSENSADIIWMTDRKGNITFASKSTEKMLGYTQEETRTLTIEELQSEEDFSKKIDALKNKFPEKRLLGQKFDPIHLEVRHIHKNGTKIWTDMLSSPLYDENDKYCGLIGIIRDNSERKANELALQESREMYRSLIELSPEGIIIINNGNIEFANREFVKMLKVEREIQIVERKFLDLIMPKDQTKLRAWLKKVVLDQAEDAMILAELKRFDGTPLYAEVMATGITVRGEKSAQLFVRDVTQKILTGKELNKEKELNESLIGSIPDYIYFKDKAGRFIKINKSFAKALGLKNPEEAVGKTDKDFFGPKHYRQTRIEEKQIIQTGKPLIGSIRREPWPKSAVQWVSVTKMPLSDSEHVAIGTFGVSRDITNQKKSESELLKREERFRHFFDQVQVGVAIINSKFEIQEINNALARIVSYPQKELLKENFLRFFSKTQGEDLKKQIENIESGKAENYQTECNLFLKNGDALHVILQVIQLETLQGMADQYLCQVVNIHNRKVAEELLLVRNNELNNFVYKVSHDLRAPLLSVKGLINLMRLESDLSRYADYIGMIEERVNKLDGFIRDVLSHSKNLNTEINFSEIDIEEIIENCFSQMAYSENASGIEKKVTVTGAKFFSDLQRIQEIFRNLISNAVVYSSNEREKSFVSVKVRTGLNLCTITIEDNGVGIKKAYLDKIFQMFYRANDLVEGSGIGLYIVQQSVQKLGGVVQVESTLNSGTKFTLSIPNNTPDNYPK